eukprot:scaffold102811_cov66-Phaeocystis_antarctica.AAC.3
MMPAHMLPARARVLAARYSATGACARCKQRAAVLMNGELAATQRFPSSTGSSLLYRIVYAVGGAGRNHERPRDWSPEA